MFLNNYTPQPVLFDLGFAQIHWYGFLITLAGALGFFVFYKLTKKFNLDKNYIFDLSFWIIIWGLIGGRIYYVLQEFNYYFQNPLEIFYIWNGGMGIYGAIVAGVIVVYYFSKKINNNNLLLLNLLAPTLALGQSIGRWGNYFNQELYGLPSNLLWAIPIELSNRLSGFENFTHFHPVFLYESLFCFLLAIFLITILIKIKNLKSGYIFIYYIFLYSSWRFFIEFLRIDLQPVFLNLRLAQWVSLFFIILSIIFFFLLHRHNKNAIIKTKELNEFYE